LRATSASAVRERAARAAGAPAAQRRSTASAVSRAAVGREPLRGGTDQLIVAADEDVDLVADVAVRDVLAGAEGARGQQPR